MTNVLHEEGDKRPPEEMRLRSSRPPVTRLSGRVLLSLAAAAAIGVAGALFFALKPQQQTVGSELYNTNNHDTPEGLANLPRDYTGLPKPVPEAGPATSRRSRPADRHCGCFHTRSAHGCRSRAAAHRAGTGGGACQPSLWTSNADQTDAPSSPTAAAAQAPVAPGGSTDLTSQDHKLAFLTGTMDSARPVLSAFRRRQADTFYKQAP